VWQIVAIARWSAHSESTASLGIGRHESFIRDRGGIDQGLIVAIMPNAPAGLLCPLSRYPGKGWGEGVL
jgi:hypothetical protein